MTTMTSAKTQELVGELINSRFHSLAQIDSEAIDVEVVGNTVLLSGSVRSWAEKGLAEDAAWSAPEVENVINRIEVHPLLMTISLSNRNEDTKYVAMEKVVLKKRIIEAAIAKQQSIVDDFRTRMRDILANDGNVNEEEYDSHSQSFKSEGIAEVNLLTDQLEFAVKELEELRRMEAFQPEHDSVEFGAVVKTDHRVFFVSASLEEFEAEGIRVFGLSVNSPLYQSMKGKKANEEFRYGKLSYRINEIF